MIIEFNIIRLYRQTTCVKSIKHYAVSVCQVYVELKVKRLK